MADVDVTQDLPLPAERPPRPSAGPIDWLRTNLFNSGLNTILTLAAVYLLAVTIPPVIRWAVVDATWHAETGRACPAGGGCGAVVWEYSGSPAWSRSGS